MFFQEDYNAPPEEESPPAGGARLFFWLLGGEAAGLLKLNLLFLLACLPVVTIPPAYHALHRLARRLVQGRGVRCWPQFWEIVRREWKTAWAAFLLTALPLAGAGYGMQFYLQFAGRNPVFYLPFTLCATIFLTALLASSYLWGLLADGRRLDRETVLLAVKLGLSPETVEALLDMVSEGGNEAALEAVDNTICAALSVIDGVFEDLDRYADSVIAEMEGRRNE